LALTHEWRAWLAFLALLCAPASACRDCRNSAGRAEMVPVPAGPFFMGCAPAEGEKDLFRECGEPEGSDHQHRVELSAFEIDRTEVTRGAYIACVRTHHCTLPPGFDLNSGTELPITGVTWQQARAFCAWAGKRLPSEAEWEKAARGTDGRLFPWGNQQPSCDRANFESCGGALKPVGMAPGGASPYGALDMAGNAEEWVNDWFASDAYVQSPSRDPAGPPADNGSGHSVRGGSFRYDAWHLRTYVRFWDPGGAAHDVGFRCARSTQ
jgi:formylglycine-generating enzyme required for sulfatase activity